MGCTEPRICTPPLRELTPATSKGFACIEFAEEILEIELLPWQRALLIRALELNPDGTYRFKTVLLLVARQNGKSTLMQVLSLWRMYAEGAPLVIGTAQSLDIAEEQWSGAVEIAEGIPELAELIDHVDRTNGKKALRLDTGERYKVAAASRRGGRGLSGDLVLLDELREHQNWQAWGAVTKTTMARKLAQIWAASNAGDMASVVLRRLRSLAHRALGWPDGKDGMDDLDSTGDATDDSTEADDSLGIFEWSAAPGRGVWDREGWAEANPSLGYTIDLRSIAAAASTDPEWVFRTEVMCQFVNMLGSGPFPTGAWAAILDTKDERAARGVTRDVDRVACYGVDMSENGMTYVALAFWDTEGRIRGEIVAHRAGPDWVIPWLKSPLRKVPAKHIAFQRRGAPISALWKDFEDADLEVTPWGDSELAGCHPKVYHLIKVAAADDAPDGETPEQFRERVRISHGVQPALDVAAASAQIKAVGDGGWVIDRKSSPADASPLVAFIAAVGLLLTNPASGETVSAYETNDLMVV
ncbi:conserved hypothetical protein [Microbacterium sp. 8M]|uniref:terminase n=1 Tax=Microbacterium sp. 8M TaxID=2653153 RepID=UPI0012EFC6EF|nr:terminase [Microbacterium sp. 8M]VXC30926.1 conserved hypothetical protein [Microbacterium sp. 8M]